MVHSFFYLRSIMVLNFYWTFICFLEFKLISFASIPFLSSGLVTLLELHSFVLCLKFASLLLTKRYINPFVYGWCYCHSLVNEYIYLFLPILVKKKGRESLFLLRNGCWSTIDVITKRSGFRFKKIGKERPGQWDT